MTGTSEIRIDNQVESLRDRARWLVNNGAIAEAKSLLASAITRDPGSYELHDALAQLYRELGQLRSLIPVYQTMLTLRPDATEVRIQLGDAHSLQGSWNQAILAYSQVLRKDPDDLHTRFRLAYAYIGGQNSLELRNIVEDLVNRAPKDARTLLLKGHLEKIFGRAPTAAVAYRMALARDPRLSEAMYNLSDIDPPKPESVLARQILDYSESATLPHAARANAEYALGRIYESAGRYGDAYAAYEKANSSSAAALKERGLNYDPSLEGRVASAIIDFYDLKTSTRPATSISLDFDPIFIVGMPRSGTSLIEQILACHDSVSPGGELPFIPQLAAEFNRWISATRYSKWSVLLERVDAEPVIGGLRSKYIERCRARGLSGYRITDKLPANVWWIGFIRLLFPGAKVIHCVRDPMATCWSLFRTNFGAHLSYRNSFEGLAHQYGLHLRLMNHWKDCLNLPLLEIAYEDLVENPRSTIARLVDACGLETQEACFNHHRLRRPVFTASHSNVFAPVSTEFKERWKVFAKHLQPLEALIREASAFHDRSRAPSA